MERGAWGRQYFARRLASALGTSGEYQEALKAIDEALERDERNEERWYLPGMKFDILGTSSVGRVSAK